MFADWFAKLRPGSRARTQRTVLFFAWKLRFPELAAASNPDLADLKPYEGLAELWHEYSMQASRFRQNYLRLLMLHGNGQIGSILDLACGTGTLTSELVSLAPDVMGLDLSEAMLTRARSYCDKIPSANFVQGDFRDFHLNRLFDMIVCSFNSLNYVQNSQELKAVFDCVAEHLKPGGCFLFDTITSSGTQSLLGRYFHVSTPKGRFVIHYEHGGRSRQSRTVVMTPFGTEVHPRIPLDFKHIKQACESSGLELRNYYGSTPFPSRLVIGPSCVFVVRKK